MGDDILISFHSPSVRDFLEDFLSNSEGDVVDLVSGAHFYEQYVAIWAGKRSHRYRGIDQHHDEFVRQLQRNIFGPSASVIRVVNRKGEPTGFRHRRVSNESRAGFALRVSNDLKSQGGERLLKGILDALEKQWEQGQADSDDLVRLLRSLTDQGLRRDDEIFRAAKRCLSSKMEESDDFRAIAQFAEAYPEELSPSDLDQVKEKFLQFAPEYVDAGDDDPDWLRQIAADLEFVGERLEVDVTRFTEPLYTRADEVETERADEERDDVDDGDGWRSSSSHSDDIDNMFQDLREELES